MDRSSNNWLVSRVRAMRLAMVEGPGHMIELLEYTSPDDRRTSSRDHPTRDLSISPSMSRTSMRCLHVSQASAGRRSEIFRPSNSANARGFA